MDVCGRMLTTMNIKQKPTDVDYNVRHTSTTIDIGRKPIDVGRMSITTAGDTMANNYDN
jgi:hypothetical protein